MHFLIFIPKYFDAFELWWWRRLLRVSWTARRANKSILKEISPGCSLEWMMLKLKLQYYGHVMGRVDSLEKTLRLGGIGGRRRRGQQRMRWLDGITDLMSMNFSKLQETVRDKKAWYASVHECRIGLQSCTWLGNSTTASFLNRNSICLTGMRLLKLSTYYWVSFGILCLLWVELFDLKIYMLKS